MAESETVLLQRFVCGGDPAAFNEIVRRHAGLVYGTCLRVLSDADQAADATQETFFQLVRKAHEVKGSVAAWLHRVAVGKAVDQIRSDARRRSREQTYANARLESDATWGQVRPHVDEALSRLDDRTRELLLRHYLEGQSMTALAEEWGVSRPTVSRHIESGLAKLRAGLRDRGVLVTAGGLGVALAENAAQSAPLSLLHEIGKVALVGARAAAVTGSGAAAGATAIATGVLAAAKTKLAIAAAVVVIGAGLLTYTRFNARPPQGPPSPPPVTGGNRRARSQRQTPTRPARPPRMAEEEAPVDSAPKAAIEQPPSPPSSVEPEEGDAEIPTAPMVPETAVSGDFEIDLSTPEGTVRSFTKALILGDAESVLSCWFTTAADLPIIQQGLNAGPDDPQEMYEGRLWIESLDPDAEMPIIRTRDVDGGVQLTWRVTLKKEVTMAGHTYQPGDTEELTGTVRQSGDSWLLDDME